LAAACGLGFGLAAGCQHDEYSRVHTRKSTNEYPPETDDPSQPAESEYHMKSPGKMVVE
jgi:hypothetical protein